MKFEFKKISDLSKNPIINKEEILNGSLQSKIKIFL